MTTYLRGITWDHTRGYVPLVATAQRFHERHQDVDVLWDRRSLQGFAHNIDTLIDHYDLLVIDHPCVGDASSQQWLLPLDQYVAPKYLAELADQSVGRSHASYQADGHPWALAIDAAAPVAVSRPDLFERMGVDKPRDWSDVVALARRGCVIVPAKKIDLLMHFYMVVNAMDGELFEDGRVAPRDIGILALESLRELLQWCPRESLDFSPIQVYEAMADQDHYAYCPFIYGYVNYSQRGYARNPLDFGDLVTWRHQAPLAGVLGGTGLAISSRTKYIAQAVSYVEYVASVATQGTLYPAAGGQPAIKSVWLDDEVNRSTHQFYRNTLPALERSYLRPTYPGYLLFQDRAGDLIHSYFRNGGTPQEVVERLDKLYRGSLEGDIRGDAGSSWDALGNRKR